MHRDHGYSAGCAALFKTRFAVQHTCTEAADLLQRIEGSHTESVPTKHLNAKGVRLQIDHLDDHKVQLKADGVTRPGQVVVIKGEGMPVFESVRCCGTTHLRPHNAVIPARRPISFRVSCLGLLTACSLIAMMTCRMLRLMQKHKGDLYVTYTVAFPPRLSDEQKRVVREHFPQASMRQLHEEL